MSILNQIGLNCYTDKSSEVHDYLNKYEKYLLFRREDSIRMLEIGVLKGESLCMWKQYFNNAKIIGLDIDEQCKRFEDDRINIEIGNQTDIKFLQQLIDKYGYFDFIIDDGSHVNQDVILTFKELFPSLKNGGQYIIEDVCTSYWTEYGGGEKKDGTIIEFFKNLIDEVNFNGKILYDYPIPCGRRDDYLIESFNKSGIQSYGKTIESIVFLNSIIIINKR